MSQKYKAIVGGEYPKHIVYVERKTKNEIDNLLNKKEKIDTATEVKVCTMTFQLTLPGLPPTVVVGARPQSNSESNDFILDIESASTQAIASTGVHPSSFFELCSDWSIM